MQGFLDRYPFLGHIAPFFGKVGCQSHHAQAPQDAGHISGHEQGRYRNTSGHGGVDDHQVGWGDQHACGGRGNVDRRAELGIIPFLFLQRPHGPADGSGSRRAGAGDGAEHHVGHHVGLSQGPGHPSGQDLCHVHQTDGDPAVIHDIAGQDEEGDGDQGKGVGSGKDPLGRGDKGNIRRQHAQHGRCGGKPDGNTDGSAHDQQDNQDRYHDDRCKYSQ
mgnify:CR=1 FL=1